MFKNRGHIGHQSATVSTNLKRSAQASCQYKNTIKVRVGLPRPKKFGSISHLYPNRPARSRAKGRYFQASPAVNGIKVKVKQQ